MWSHRLLPGEIAAQTILGENLVLYRTETGAVVAMEDRRPHRFAPLSLDRSVGLFRRLMARLIEAGSSH